MGHVLPFVPLHVSTDTLSRLFGADADRARVLAQPGAGALLFDWLHLASPAGIQALRDAALDQGVSLPADVDERSRGAWACDVLALAARDPAWRAVLARVRATASRDRPAHASYDARLAGRVAIGDPRDVEERIARELAARLAPSGQGRELRVRVTCGAHVEIALAHDDTSATALLAVDRIAGDTAVRLHVLARPLVGLYLAALGSALAASPIARRRSVSLLPIAQRRAAVLVPSRATSAELAHVRAIALEWDGDDDRGVLRGHDVLASAERRGMRLENGALVEVVLRLVLRAVGAGVVDVWVREPDEVTLSDERHLPLVRRLLADAGVVPAADGAPDLWSLEPWAHPEDVWASALGADAVSRLSSAQILTPLRARAVASRAAPAASRSLVALPLADEPGAWWGTTEDPSVRAVTLRDPELAVRSLDVARLGAAWQQKLRLAGPRPSLDAHGVLDLGHRVEKRGGVRVFLIAASPGTRVRALALAERVRRASVPDVPVLLVPDGRTLELGLAEAHVRDWSSDGRAVLRDVLREAGLLEDVALVDLAPPDARLVVCTRTARAWLDTRLLKLTSAPFALLVALARRGNAVVATSELGAAISRRHDADVTARQARLALAKAVTAAFGKRAPAVVVAVGKRGYRLGLSAFVGGGEE